MSVSLSKISVPKAISSESNNPSLSSSKSELFPTPSLSLSEFSKLFKGKASIRSGKPSSSSSISTSFVNPSPSVSIRLESISLAKEAELKSSKKRQTKNRKIPIAMTLIFINYSYMQTLLYLATNNHKVTLLDLGFST